MLMNGPIHLTAVALAPDILVNCIAPGFLEGTRATSNLDPEYRERVRRGSLLRRPVDKDDVGKQVVERCRTEVMDAGRVFHQGLANHS